MMTKKLDTSASSPAQDVLKLVEMLAPMAASQALQSYERFADTLPSSEDDAKAFAAHHSACKAALSHLETLLKMTEWAEKHTHADGATSDARAQAKALQKMLGQARGRLVDGR